MDQQAILSWLNFNETKLTSRFVHLSHNVSNNGFVTWWSHTIHLSNLTDSEACGRHVWTIDNGLQQLGDADKDRMNNSFSIAYIGKEGNPLSGLTKQCNFAKNVSITMNYLPRNKGENIVIPKMFELAVLDSIINIPFLKISEETLRDVFMLFHSSPERMRCLIGVGEMTWTYYVF